MTFFKESLRSVVAGKDKYSTEVQRDAQYLKQTLIKK
jgi:hypothetical protein